MALTPCPALRFLSLTSARDWQDLRFSKPCPGTPSRACRVLLHPQFPNAMSGRAGRSGGFSGAKLVPPEPSDSFGRAQFRAARSRVAIDFCFTRSHGLSGQQAVETLFRSVAEGVFHHAVLERVETDDHQPASRFQPPRRGFEQLPQVV